MKQFMLIALMALVSVISAGAQTSEKSTKATSSTEILQTIAVPEGTTLHTGTTRTGNAKYWITLTFGEQSVNVTVAEGLAKKYQAGTAKIEVVKRKNKTTGKITYSSRTLGGGRTTKPNTDINLTQAKFN